MSNPFTRTYPRLRRVETRLRDTPQKIAARELADARRWIEIVAINGLSPPYITDDPALAGPAVVLSGATIQIPDDGAAAISDSSTDPAKTFGIDLALDDDLSIDADGDFAVVAGVPNLRQALVNRLPTPAGSLLFHLSYGNPAIALIGERATPAAVRLANELVQRSVQADDRIARTAAFTTALSGDTLSISGTAIAIDGTAVDVQT